MHSAETVFDSCLRCSLQKKNLTLTLRRRRPPTPPSPFIPQFTPPPLFLTLSPLSQLSWALTRISQLCVPQPQSLLASKCHMNSPLYQHIELWTGWFDLVEKREEEVRTDIMLSARLSRLRLFPVIYIYITQHRTIDSLSLQVCASLSQEQAAPHIFQVWSPPSRPYLSSASLSKAAVLTV